MYHSDELSSIGIITFLVVSGHVIARDGEGPWSRLVFDEVEQGDAVWLGVPELSAELYLLELAHALQVH